MEDEKELPQTRNGFKKLYGKPVEVEIFTRWKPTGEEKDGVPKMEPDEKSGVKAWLHPMTDEENWDVEAVGVEAYREFLAKGAARDSALWKSNRVEKCLKLFYSIRVSSEAGAARLFETHGEVANIFSMEIERLINIYDDAFIPTGEEIKNSLRERLGQPLGTASSSPSTSTTGK